MTTSPLLLRLATLLFPPAGLVLLWRMPGKLGRKILGTLGIVLFSVLYAALVIFLLMQFTNLQIEWRGGYLPALTYRKTRTNYEAVERNRSRRNSTVASTNAAISAKPYWTNFRGPHFEGHYDEQPILTNWPSAGLRQLWRQPCGGGYDSFAIADGRAFTLEQRRDDEVLVAYELETGRELWTNSWPAHFQEFFSDDGPRATPTYDEGKIYALGALGDFRCLEATNGKVLWSQNIVARNGGSTPTYGVAASPVILEEKLILLTGQSVVCYDKHNGKSLWTSLEDVTGYATPVLVTLAGQQQLIVCCENRTAGLRLEDGKLLWEYPWHVLNNQLPIAQPLMLSTNRFMLSAGYFTGCAVVEVTKTENGFSARTVWKNKNLKNKFSSSVFYEGHIYGLDEDMLTCLDATTGERKWKDGRYDYGQVLLAGGFLVILSGSGELALVKANPERHEELARFQAINGKTWNYPAIAHGRILVRNAVEMACFDLPSK